MVVSARLACEGCVVKNKLNTTSCSSTYFLCQNQNVILVEFVISMWVNPDLVHVQSSPHNYTGWGGGEENTQRLLLRPAREAGMAEVGKTELERSRCTGPCGSSHGGCSDGGGALWGPDGMSLMPSTGSSGSRMKNSYHKRGGVSSLTLCTCSAKCR